MCFSKNIPHNSVTGYQTPDISICVLTNVNNTGVHYHELRQDHPKQFIRGPGSRIECINLNVTLRSRASLLLRISHRITCHPPEILLPETCCELALVNGNGLPVCCITFYTMNSMS